MEFGIPKRIRTYIMIKVGDQVKMTAFYAEKYASHWVEKFKNLPAIVLSVKNCTRWKADGTEEQILAADGKPFYELIITFENDQTKYIVSNAGFEPFK